MYTNIKVTQPCRARLPQLSRRPGPRNAYQTAQAHKLPDAILFDCDGVLVDTEKDGHRVAFNKAFTQKGMLPFLVAWPLHLVANHMTRSTWQVYLTTGMLNCTVSFWK
jgi:hypothetical protein